MTKATQWRVIAATMLVLIAAAVALAVASTASLKPSNRATDSYTVQLHTSPPERGDTHWTAIVAVTNSGAPSGLSHVGLDCTFTYRGAPVDVAGLVASNIAYRETIYAKAIGAESARAVDAATCRASYTRPK